MTSQIRNFILNTVPVLNSMFKYETALCNNEEWTVLEGYDTIEESEKGHEKWKHKIINSGSINSITFNK